MVMLSKLDVIEPWEFETRLRFPPAQLDEMIRNRKGASDPDYTGWLVIKSCHNEVSHRLSPFEYEKKYGIKRDVVKAAYARWETQVARPSPATKARTDPS